MRAWLLAAATVLTVSPAFAQDAWNGAYVGAHAGFSSGDVSVTDTNGGVDPGPFNYTVNGGFGGLTAGYNWSSGNLFAGIEGDVGYMAPNGSGIIGSAHADSHQNLTLGDGIYGDVAARLGFALDSTLFYAKGGPAFFSGSAQQATTNPGYTPTGTSNFGGWGIGAGVEEAITSNISIKAEYMHYGFGAQQGYQTSTVEDGGTPAGYKYYNSTTLGFDTVKVGLNYHF